ncbi:MAG: hypothetical protein RLZZ303_3543, partial [Candidatus Hydrogenedentota bacterium]
LRTPADLGNVRTLLLTYEGQKPLKPGYHEVLAQWVREGGNLLIVDDNADPFNAVKEWWNDNGATTRTPRDALLETLGMEASASEPVVIGKGSALLLDSSPSYLSRRTSGPATLLNALTALMGSAPSGSNALVLKRGPYLIAACLDEVESPKAQALPGTYVDLFDASHSVRINPTIEPGQRVLYRRVDTGSADQPSVLAASARIRDFQHIEDRVRFTTRGPAGTRCRILLQLPKQPETVQVDGQPASDFEWDETNLLLRVSFDNAARSIAVHVTL